MTPRDNRHSGFGSDPLDNEQRFKHVEEMIAELRTSPWSMWKFIFAAVAALTAFATGILTFGNWTIEKALAPINIQLDYQRNTLNSLEGKVDRLVERSGGRGELNGHE